jgi:hypothetical protein
VQMHCLFSQWLQLMRKIILMAGQLSMYMGSSNLNENLVPFRAQINLYECACADKL